LFAGGIDIKAGQWVTLEGAETIDPTTNYLYTHTYIFNFGIPFTETGALVTWHVDPLLDIYTGVSGGVNTTLGYRRGCYAVLTDSGGIQEEAPSLGKPVLVLRNTTERPEIIDVGCGRLVGTGSANIVAETTRLLDDADAYRKASQEIN